MGSGHDFSDGFAPEKVHKAEPRESVRRMFNGKKRGGEDGEENIANGC